MKKLLILGLVLTLAISMTACSNKGSATENGAESTEDPANDTVYALKLSTVLSEGDPLPQHMMELAASLEERTNGQIKVEVLPDGVLGDTGQVLEQAKSGMAVGVILDAGRFADYVPEMNIFEAPYLFEDYSEALLFTQSDMFNGWVSQAEQYGIHVSSWNWYQGARHFWTQKELKTLDDFANLKIRTGTSPMWQEIVKSFGATPVALAGNEVYSGLQQKVIDGMEGQLVTFGSFEEVLSHITKTGHFLLLSGIVVSDQWYASMPEELQAIFDEEVEKFGTKYSEHVLGTQAEMEDILTERGFVINDFDLALLKDASDVVYDKFDGFRELKEEIQTIVKEAK